MSLKELPYNDMMAQCTRKLIKVSKEEEQKRINEIANCNHLFVKLRDYEPSEVQDEDNVIIECVNCGVTNKYMGLERTMLRYRKSLEYYVYIIYHLKDLEYNSSTIETIMMDKIRKNNSNIQIMSNKVIRSNHPGILYKIAKIINPDASNEELFEIMLKLHEIETAEERKKLNSIEEANDLILRYKENNKTLKKTI